MKVNEVIQTAVRVARLSALKDAMKERIVPEGWNQVDEVVHQMLMELLMVHTAQMATLMAALNEAGVHPSEDVMRLNLEGQIVATALGSMLMSHFDVTRSNGRNVNDAHLHFDRVLRAANEDEAMVFEVVGDVSDGECNNPNCPIHGKHRHDGSIH